jgi:hypothetical protein
MHDYPQMTHTEHHHNYTIDFDMSLNQKGYMILFYIVIIVFIILLFIQFTVIFYYCCKQCENTPCKRISRNSGIKLELGEMNHCLDRQEVETLKRVENQS